jgi:serine/threonine protein kinase
MIPPKDILDYLVAELRVGASAPEDVLSHVREAWVWDETSTRRLQADIREAHDGGRLTDAEAGGLSRGIEAWPLDSILDDDPTESIDHPAIVAMQLTREWHDGPSLELRPGVVLRDRYVLGDAVARGGQSIVFRAHVLRDDDGARAGQAVAIKVLRDANPSAAAVARLEREFRQTQSLRHAGVANMFDLGCDRGTWFIAMELLEGMSLRTRLKRVATQPLERSEALQIVAACGTVLARAHSQGFAHGDVKPANLFLQASGEIKVLDFGDAYDVQPATPGLASEARAAAPAATRTYASPEVLDGLAAEPRDDIFSLACVAYEMLAGRHPFSRMPANDARARSMKVMPVVGLTPRQNAALGSALAWSRSRRPSSIEAWLDALLDRGPSVAVRPRPATPPLTPAEWLPWRWIGAVATVATVLLVVIWWASRSSDGWITAPEVVADPRPNEAQFQDEPLAEASQAPSIASTVESTVAAAATVAAAQPSTDAATSQPPGNVVRPPGASTANRPRIAADTASVRSSEGAPAAVVVLRRSGNLAVPVTVTWQLEAGSAQEGEDFTTPTDRSARFAAGQTTRAIYVPLVNDGQAEPEEVLSMTFRSRAAAVDDSSRVTITILDDD